MSDFVPEFRHLEALNLIYSQTQLTAARKFNPLLSLIVSDISVGDADLMTSRLFIPVRRRSEKGLVENCRKALRL